jgi:hypothetical protein
MKDDIAENAGKIATLEGQMSTAEGKISALEGASATHATKTELEEAVADLEQADIDNLAAAKKYTDDEIAELKIADYVKKVDADAAYAAAGHNHDDKYDAIGAAADVKTELETAIETAQSTLEGEIAKKVDKVEGKSLVADTEITKLAGVSEGANKVEASTTNGKIKIDGVETTVYTHPTAHTISEVTGLQDALDLKLEADDIADKADKATTLAGYGIADAYTKAEVEAMLTWGEF